VRNAQQRTKQKKPNNKEITRIVQNHTKKTITEYMHGTELQTTIVSRNKKKNYRASAE